MEYALSSVILIIAAVIRGRNWMMVRTTGHSAMKTGDDDEGSPDTEEFQNVVKQSLVQWVVECNIPLHVSNSL
jgi:hypothetical protein